MNFLARLLVFSVLAAASVTFAADSFEGRVSLQLKADRKEEIRINYAMKQGMIRMEPQVEGAPGMAVIYDVAKQRMTMLMPEQSMYMEMPMAGMMGEMKGKSGEKVPELTKTGRTETILGYSCEEYTMTDGGVTTELWVTDQLGTFMGISGGNPMGGMMGGRGAPATPGWEAVLKGRQGFFPLRVVGRDKNGKESMRMEVTGIQKESLPDSLFSAPAGFQKFSMPGFGR